MRLQAGLLTLLVLPLALTQRRYGQNRDSLPPCNLLGWFSTPTFTLPDHALCKPDCSNVRRCAAVKCPGGSIAPVPKNGCCPDPSLYPPDCQYVRCFPAKCPDGSVAPVPNDGCCPDTSLCKPDCRYVRCFPAKCLDGSIAPRARNGCCPDPSLC